MSHNFNSIHPASIPITSLDIPPESQHQILAILRWPDWSVNYSNTKLSAHNNQHHMFYFCHPVQHALKSWFSLALNFNLLYSVFTKTNQELNMFGIQTDDDNDNSKIFFVFALIDTSNSNTLPMWKFIRCGTPASLYTLFGNNNNFSCLKLASFVDKNSIEFKKDYKIVSHLDKTYNYNVSDEITKWAVKIQEMKHQLFIPYFPKIESNKLKLVPGLMIPIMTPKKRKKLARSMALLEADDEGKCYYISSVVGYEKCFDLFGSYYGLLSDNEKKMYDWVAGFGNWTMKELVQNCEGVDDEKSLKV